VPATEVPLQRVAPGIREAIILWIDWLHISFELRLPQVYEGTLRFASSRVIQAWKEDGPFPVLRVDHMDDLHSWVRMCLYFVSASARDHLSATAVCGSEIGQPEALAALDTFWLTALADSYVTSLFDAIVGATTVDWDGIEKLVPLAIRC
jgi:hypothetical protein